MASPAIPVQLRPSFWAAKGSGLAITEGIAGPCHPGSINWTTLVNPDVLDRHTEGICRPRRSAGHRTRPAGSRRRRTARVDSPGRNVGARAARARSPARPGNGERARRSRGPAPPRAALALRTSGDSPFCPPCAVDCVASGPADFAARKVGARSRRPSVSCASPSRAPCRFRGAPRRVRWRPLASCW